ncbi:RDD family protein [Oceanobacillus senegalensis]|uniref:RDD family protein n=1 Tax=Oceanobacillus senegalensis TaxID=1936063 RepID=UPI001C4FEF86
MLLIGSLLSAKVIEFLASLIKIFIIPFSSSIQNFFTYIIEIADGVSSIIGFILFLFSYLLLYIRRRTVGDKLFGLQWEAGNNLALLTKYLIRYGLLLIVYHCEVVFGMESVFLITTMNAYIVYHIVDSFILLWSKGNKTLTDKWLGIVVLEIPRKKKS